jgi:hypothetical protein
MLKVSVERKSQQQKQLTTQDLAKGQIGLLPRGGMVLRVVSPGSDVDVHFVTLTEASVSPWLSNYTTNISEILQPGDVIRLEVK